MLIYISYLKESMHERTCSMGIYICTSCPTNKPVSLTNKLTNKPVPLTNKLTNKPVFSHKQTCSSHCSLTNKPMFLSQTNSQTNHVSFTNKLTNKPCSSHKQTHKQTMFLSQTNSQTNPVPLTKLTNKPCSSHKQTHKQTLFLSQTNLFLHWFYRLDDVLPAGGGGAGCPLPQAAV